MSDERAGRLKAYLGAAPGVGKTYRMLDEGRRRAARGADVVVGFVECHGRPHTEAMLDGVEVLRARCTYRGGEFTEMDLGTSRRSRVERFVGGRGTGETVVELSGDIDVHMVTHERAGRGTLLPSRRRTLSTSRLIARPVAGFMLPVFLTLGLRRLRAAQLLVHPAHRIVHAGRYQQHAGSGRVRDRRRHRRGRGGPVAQAVAPLGARHGRAGMDRGPGIPPDRRDQLFEPSQRLGDTDNTTGLGLGIALARGLTEAMDGTLTPEDTPGGGLTMVLSLPSAKPAEHSRDTQSVGGAA